jgi:hypothetical protein
VKKSKWREKGIGRGERQKKRQGEERQGKRKRRND